MTDTQRDTLLVCLGCAVSRMMEQAVIGWDKNEYTDAHDNLEAALVPLLTHGRIVERRVKERRQTNG